MNRAESIKNIAIALCKFQAEIKNPKNTATNPMFKSNYAPLDVVINTVKPILSKYGLSFIQSTGSEGESVIITTLLIHESGEWIESDPLILPAYQNRGGGKLEFNAQGAGSSISYGRRYSLSAMLGVSSEDDDDANGASGSANNKPPKTITEKQVVELKTKALKFAKLRGGTEIATLEALKITDIESINENEFNQCMKQLDVWISKVEKESA